MKNILTNRYAIMIFMISLSFVSVMFYLRGDVETTDETAKSSIPVVLYQDLDDYTVSELFEKGQKNYKERKYDQSFKYMISARQKSNLKDPLRSKIVLSIAKHYLYGRGTKRNLDKAHALLTSKEFLRSVPAQFIVGIIFLNKKFSNYSLDKAYKIFSSAQLSRSKGAQYYTGFILSKKEFSGYSLSKAREYLKKSEKMGMKKASDLLLEIGR